MTWVEFIADYEIVGSTIKPADDALPLRLMPVYRKRGDAAAYYLSMESDIGDDPPELLAEDPEWVKEQLAVVFDPPIRPQPGFWLMQFRPREQPEYIPSHALSKRLQAAYDEALARAEQSVQGGDLAEAREALFFAARTRPSNPASEPLPQLALIPLLRPILSSDDLEFFIHDIQNSYQKKHIDKAMVQMQEMYKNLWGQFQADAWFQGQGAARGLAVGCFLDRAGTNKTTLPRIATLRSFWRNPQKRPPQPASRAA